MRGRVPPAPAGDRAASSWCGWGRRGKTKARSHLSVLGECDDAPGLDSGIGESSQVSATDPVHYLRTQTQTHQRAESDCGALPEGGAARRPVTCRGVQRRGGPAIDSHRIALHKSVFRLGVQVHHEPGRRSDGPGAYPVAAHGSAADVPRAVRFAAPPCPLTRTLERPGWNPAEHTVRPLLCIGVAELASTAFSSDREAGAWAKAGCQVRVRSQPERSGTPPMTTTIPRPELAVRVGAGAQDACVLRPSKIRKDVVAARKIARQCLPPSSVAQRTFPSREQ
jgi:hypothetical protein